MKAFIIELLNVITNITVIWLFRKNYLESKVNNRLLSVNAKDKLETHRTLLLSKKIESAEIIIKDVYTEEEIRRTEFADIYDYGIQIATKITWIKKSKCGKKWSEVLDAKDGDKTYIIGYIPYINIINFDEYTINGCREYVLWCKFIRFTKFHDNSLCKKLRIFLKKTPYTKITYCKQIARSGNAEQYGYFYAEITDPD